jgi:hypothetical protein
MTERTEKFAKELDALLLEGNELYMAIQYDCHRTAFTKAAAERFQGNKEKTNEYLSKLPDFKTDYQRWYSVASAVVQQVLPARSADFISYYEIPKPRKEITFQNYMIKDYLQGLVLRRMSEIVTDGSAAIPEFVQQLNILKAARYALGSSLIDLKAILQADLFDSEIDTAKALAKAGYLRAAGAICGVVIEKHLSHVCEVHEVKINKKNPGISDLNQLLRDKEFTTVPQWRFIQHLADIRNLCDHAKGREPTKEEIDDLVGGSAKVLKTVY